MSKTPTDRSRRRRLPVLSVLALFYGTAVVVAAWAGFQLGRWSDDRASDLADVGTQLAIEVLAWRENDAALFQTTLDPDASPKWRSEAMQRFVERSPEDRAYAVQETEELSPGLVRVLVEVSSPEGTWIEERTYRLVGRSWFRTAAR